MKLYEKKHLINGEEVIVRITKDDTPCFSDDRDYYQYHCHLLKPTCRLFKKFDVIYSYSTYWLKYFDYYGNIDKVINEFLSNYKKKLDEEKYINDKESKWNL